MRGRMEKAARVCGAGKRGTLKPIEVSSSHLGREQSSSHTVCTMRGSNPRRIHQSALLWESWRFLQIKFNPPRPLRQCGNTRHLVKGSDEQLARGSSILPSRTSEVCKSAWLVSAATADVEKTPFK